MQVATEELELLKLLCALQLPGYVRDKWRKQPLMSGIISLANGRVLDRFDHLPEAVLFHLERFALEPFHARLHYSKNHSGTVLEPFHCIV